jgi:hypothetical protein
LAIDSANHHDRGSRFTSAEGETDMDTAYISALAALSGSAIGAMASFATTWLTQHAQDRAQQRQRELGRRERLFGEFIDESAKLYAHALTHPLSDPSQLVVLYGTIAKMRLFASAETIGAADAVLDLILDIYHADNAQAEPYDSAVTRKRLAIFEAFTTVARKELI